MNARQARNILLANIKLNNHKWLAKKILISVKSIEKESFFIYTYCFHRKNSKKRINMVITADTLKNVDAHNKFKIKEKNKFKIVVDN